MRFHLQPWQQRLLLIGLWIYALLLSGCADPSLLSQQPVPDAETVQPAGDGKVPEAGDTPSETATLIASTTPTRTLLGTATLPPEPTQTRAVPTPSPRPTRTPAPSQTPSPTPTPQPSARLGAALRHRDHGDYDQTIAAYLAILEDEPTLLESREARFRLAESYLLNRQYPSSAAAWQAFIADYPDDGRLAQAALMAARAYRAVDECEQAIPLLQAHLKPEATLADLGYEWIGDCYRDEQDLEQALTAYQQAVDVTHLESAEAGLREKIAAIHLGRDKEALAVAEYDAILLLALGERHRVRIEHTAGRVQSAAGQIEEAHARFRRVVDGYPQTEYAYLSLVELLDAGQEVDAFQQGLVGYHAGSVYPDAYEVAIRAFDRYLTGESVPRAGEALYYKALAQRGLGRAGSALHTLDMLIHQNPESQWLARAWFEKAATLAWGGSVNEAIKAYEHTAASFPTDELAPQALWDAAELGERSGRPIEAARLYQSLQASFPGDHNAAEALWRVAFAQYLAGDVGQATATWQALANRYAESDFGARALYWLGKLAGPGASQAESKTWDELLATHPSDYYGLRAAQILSGESLTSTRFVTGTVEPAQWDASGARVELLEWFDSWTEVPNDAGSGTLEGPTAPEQQHQFERVEVLLDIGMRKAALAEAGAMRQAAWNDPLELGRLALFLHERGLHDQAARCAIQLAKLWPDGDLYDAPPALQRLAYPLAYTDLLSVEAQDWNLDPLLLASIIRQESLFEPSAESVVGARGLGQVMPATGSWIAGRLGRGDFAIDDLFRPSVSIEFGAYYLNWTLGVFDDHILVALAAYNGGPGNVRRWLEATGYDLDLFVETMTAEESRRYLRKVYEGYSIYENLYRDGDMGR